MTLSSKTPENIKYPNQPLVEVACEIRFYGEPSTETKRDIFFEQIRNDYPLVFVPAIKPGVHPSLQHYKFEDEDRTAGVSLALNSFGYFQREYQGAEKYIQEVMRLFRLADEIFKIQRYSRMGWRYINVIPFARENEYIPLGRLLKEVPGLFAIESDTYENISFWAKSRLEDVSVSVKLDSDSSKKESEQLILDVDVHRDKLGKDFKSDDVEKLLSHLHCIGRNFFESSITDSYRTYLKGSSDG